MLLSPHTFRLKVRCCFNHFDTGDVVLLTTNINTLQWRTTRILGLPQRYKRTGECLAGAYFWSTDMILIDQVSRQRIEDVIAHLLNENEFEMIFTQLPSEEVQED